ncbi:DNA primase, partial [Phocaeicola dorei]
PEDVILVNESERLYPRCNDFNEFLQKAGCPAAGHEI